MVSRGQHNPEEANVADKVDEKAAVDAKDEKSSNSNVVTGVNEAWVNTKRPAPNQVILVKEGDELPADLADGERERLDKLGVFDPHPRVRRDEVMAAAVAGARDGYPIPVPDGAFMSEDEAIRHPELLAAAEARAND
jgi:hypothetical protein